MPATKEEIIQKLAKFRLVDKYVSFGEAMPEVVYADGLQRRIVSDILDSCAKELIYMYKTAKKKPAKAVLKKILQLSMNAISHATLDDENKEFAYKLCWFLAEKTEINLPRQTAKKHWGYWQIVDEEVQTVKYRKPKNKLGE